MRALTLYQPWAGQVFDRNDPKDIENRRTLTPPRALLDPTPRPFFAIHAGLQYDDAPLTLARGAPWKRKSPCWPFPGGTFIPTREQCVFGAVLGIARVAYAFDQRHHRTIGVIGGPNQELQAGAMSFNRWWLGPIGWKLMDVIPLAEPVPCKGALGVWTLPVEVEQKVVRRAIRSVKEELLGRAGAGTPGRHQHWVDAMPRMQIIDLVRAEAALLALAEPA